MSPRISVVIPTFDRRDVLSRAVASVLAQSLADFELLVVDDGSTDGTAARFASHPDRRLRWLPQEHRGVSAARNMGARLAEGEILTFLDSDDEATPEWLERLTAPFASPQVGIACCGARAVEWRDGRRISEKVLLPSRLGAVYYDGPLRYTAGALAVRRPLFLAVGGYDETLAFSENTELALRLVPACLDRGLEVAPIAEALVLYHRQAGGWRSGTARAAAVRVASERILERHGPRMRIVQPAAYANYRGVAAVAAARLGDITAARRHLVAALRQRPSHWRHYPRLALTLVPPLARRYWNRRDALVEGAAGT
jgi:glycosyltransferase involved in cell wall biosynthesis